MENIQQILKEIEQKKNIRILYACETGSRAWGFPSPDSDYDIRFIYMHDRDWYLSLSQKKDTIEYMDGDWDITGWDLRKSLVMLKKSNAALIERFQSPIVYYPGESFSKEFRELIHQFYSPTAVFYHHYSLVQKFGDELNDSPEVKLKSWFYFVRSLLSCNWIIKDKSVLPMDIEGLMGKIDDEQRGEIRRLIKLKSGVTEKYLHRQDKRLDEWTRKLRAQIDGSKDNLGFGKTDYSILNEFFLKMVNANADN